jgi:hypothetical protein
MQDEDGTMDRPATVRVSRARRWAGALLLGGILAVLTAALVGLSIRASSTAPARIHCEPVELHPQGYSLDAHFESLLKEIGEAHGGATPGIRQNILLSPRQYDGRNAAFGYQEPWGGQTEDVPLRSR